MSASAGWDRVMRIAPDPARSVRATGLLAPFADAEVLTTADIQVAAALIRILDPHRTTLTTPDELVRLGAAFCVHGVRHGSITIDLGQLARTTTTDDGQHVEGLPWPDVDEWLAACSAHPAVASTDEVPDRPLRLHGTRLYLRKYWDQESAILGSVTRRVDQDHFLVDTTRVAAALAKQFPGVPAGDRQRLAAAAAIATRFMILAGGPGTGKTTTIAQILALLREIEGEDFVVALAAPTGKAAARMQQATNDRLAELYPDGDVRVRASTIHRLLGWTPNPARPFRHDRHNPLPHDVVVIDECSMVDVAMMRRLLDAVREDALLILVGDPDQLASIDAGAVLGDLVAVERPLPASTDERVAAMLPEGAATEPLSGCNVVTLTQGHRFDGAIARLARAVGAGDEELVMELLQDADGGSEVEFIDVDGPPTISDLVGLRAEITTAAEVIRAAAHDGDAEAALTALDQHRVLCAHREGPYGVARWNELIRSWTSRGSSPKGDEPDDWQIGQGLIVTANDDSLGLRNGDAGVIVAGPEGPRAAFTGPDGPLLIPPLRLDAVTSLEAMTIHRGQGSQFSRVTVILPEPGSLLLTRELLYTAITRAQHTVRLVGSRESVRTAVRRRVVRASGLTDRLSGAFSPPDVRT